jgi:quercetin dioxygenase-like cupin family protein
VGESNGKAMMQHDAHPGVNPAEETVQVGPTRVRFLVTGAGSNGSVATFELSIPPGAGLPAPPHSHDAYEETIYGLRGVSTWIVDGVDRRGASAGVVYPARRGPRVREPW